MKSVIVRSPTRVDLAGGTLDLWPLYNFIGGASMINIAIDIYTTAEITPLERGEIELISDDLKFQKSFRNLDECLKDSDRKLDLLKAQLRYWRPQAGFRLQTRSESPVGGGLGGSSSLTISLLKAFSQFCQKDLGSVQQMVHVAHNIESEILNTPTGTQDYYPAASGGINILKYSANGIEQEVLDSETSVLSQNFLLVYTGKAHHSGLNNFEVLTKAVQRDENTMKALWQLKEVAEETISTVRKRQWHQLPELFQQEYKARVKLAPAFSSPEIEKLAEVSLQAGASAVKICGAGGGGCVLVWTEPSSREKVQSACQEAGFQVLAAKPVGKLPAPPKAI
jgi:D-glycero-alpha-D-manno-heptose-7-phosphate kinase